MLEGVLIVLHVVVVVVRVGKEIVPSTERILCADVQDGQAEILRTLNPEDVLRLRIEVLAEFVAKVGVDVLVADDLDGIVATN